MSEVTKEMQDYMKYLTNKYAPVKKGGKPYSLKEFERRHKIIDELFYKKFPMLKSKLETKEKNSKDTKVASLRSPKDKKFMGHTGRG